MVFIVGSNREFNFQHKDMILSSPLNFSPEITHKMDSHPISKVLPFLYLGDIKDANDRGGLAAIGITHVLNVTARQRSPSPAVDHGTSVVVYKCLPVLDNAQANLKQYFEEAFEFIGK